MFASLKFLGLVFVCVGSLILAQDPTGSGGTQATGRPDPVRQEAKGVKSSDLVLEFYEPKHNSPDELASAARQLYGRKFIVVDATDGSPSSVSNMNTLGATVLIYDTAQNVRMIRKGLEAMDLAAKRQESPQGALETVEYQVKHLSSDDLEFAVRPFRRDVETANTSRGRQQTQPNISIFPNRGTIVIRDVSSNVAAITSALERMDRPNPQMTISFLVLKGVGEKSQTGLPPDLVESLSQLAFYGGFEVLATNVIRTDASGGRQVSIGMKLDAASSGQVSFTLGGWDDVKKRLNFTSLLFEMRTEPVGDVRGVVQSMQTSTTVGADDYTVLGAFGNQPIFVCVRVQRAD